MNDNNNKKTSVRFIETCPRNLDFFPINSCKWGKNKVNDTKSNKKDSKNPQCPWYIDDESSQYCFWVFMSKQDNCVEHTLEEIANLTKTSINNIKLAETSGIKRIVKFIRNNSLNRLMRKLRFSDEE